ncbi:MAG: MBL fold metallo-hydrolase [Chitinophagaceae bacterium]|nr:MAG: MBL fold metallo-hydrolase [Chitinophagaceae bacterium]
MNLHAIDTGFFKLDGGAMFGVVPKSIWQRSNEADANNMCNWAMRCLLIEDGNRLILVDNGIGNKQDDKFMGHYFLNGDASLDSSLASKGFSKDDVTDVFLTHLHFDHCGGSIMRAGDKLIPAFKNARFWSNEQHWKWATEPNAREKASFLKENILPIQESGQLNFIKTPEEGSASALPLSVFPSSFQVMHAYGHTDAMMLPKIQYKGRTVVFMADLLPSIGHIPLPYVMAYDMFPLQTLQEKKAFLNEAAENEYVLMLEHDPVHECCTVELTEKGVRLKETFRLSDI